MTQLRLLERLRRGPVTNYEMSQEMKIYKYTGRLSNLREKLFMVDGQALGNGLWRYELK